MFSRQPHRATAANSSAATPQAFSRRYQNNLVIRSYLVAANW
jgi:hypothetical protein